MSDFVTYPSRSIKRDQIKYLRTLNAVANCRQQGCLTSDNCKFDKLASVMRERSFHTSANAG